MREEKAEMEVAEVEAGAEVAELGKVLSAGFGTPKETMKLINKLELYLLSHFRLCCLQCIFFSNNMIFFYLKIQFKFQEFDETST